MVTGTSTLHPDTESAHRSSNRWIWAALIALCLIGAVAVFGRIAILHSPPRGGPAEMASINVLFAREKALTLVHVIMALLFVALVPFYFMRRLRRPLHRQIGWAVIASGGVLGVTALVMSVRI